MKTKAWHRIGALVVMGALCASAAFASPTVTMDFSGDVVITGNGGLVDYPFSGSLTWDPAATLVSTGCFGGGTSCYPASATFIFNSTDETANIANASIANIAPATLFEFGFDFSPFIFLSGVPSPITLFIGTTLSADPFNGLPTDLTQLLHSATSSGFSLGEGEFTTSADGTLAITEPPPPGSTPEPATVALIGIGLAALGFSRRAQALIRIPSRNIRSRAPKSHHKGTQRGELCLSPGYVLRLVVCLRSLLLRSPPSLPRRR